MLHVGFLAAFAVHVTGLIAFAVLASMDNRMPYKWNPVQPWLEAIFEKMQEDWQKLQQGPAGWGALGIAPALLAISTLLVAVVVTPFGAGVERLQDSLGHALRRTWLHTWHVVLIAFLIVITPDAIGALIGRFSPFSPIGIWLHKWQYFLCGIMPTPFVIWVAWALLRGVAAPRTASSDFASPLCIQCGYMLRGLPNAGRCPECGAKYALSVVMSEEVTHLLQQRQRIGLGRAVTWAWSRPRELAMTLVVPAPDLRHMNLFSLGMMGVLVGIASYVYSRAISSNLNYGYYFREQSEIITNIGGLLIVVFSAASWVSLWRERRRSRRNILSAAAQVGCYLSIRPAFHALLALCTIAVIRAYPRIPVAVARALGARWAGVDEVIAVTCLAIVGVAVVSFMRRVLLAARLVRYAQPAQP
jgi:hypothetical protein